MHNAKHCPDCCEYGIDCGNHIEVIGQTLGDKVNYHMSEIASILDNMDQTVERMKVTAQL